MENHAAICKHELESVTDMETSLSLLFGGKEQAVIQERLWYHSLSVWKNISMFSQFLQGGCSQDN